jgi:hypothetical protein
VAADKHSKKQLLTFHLMRKLVLVLLAMYGADGTAGAALGVWALASGE